MASKHPVFITFPILIIYSAIVVYVSKAKLIPSMKEKGSQLPDIFIFIGIIFFAYMLYGSVLSLYVGKSYCNKIKGMRMALSGLIMFFWVLLATLCVFWFVGLSMPFYTIFGATQKAEIIAYTFFIVLFAVLSSTVAFYDTKVNVCGPDMLSIEDNARYLDKKLNQKD
jgi:uncharacterized membrane protein